MTINVREKYVICIMVMITLVVEGASAVPEADPHYQLKSSPQVSLSDGDKSITDALLQIAQILQTNQQQSTLYDRVAILEASLKLSLDTNKVLEKRIKELERNIPAMMDKIDSSSNLLEKMESLERDTTYLMESFEEKLSTLAGELVRLKQVTLPPMSSFSDHQKRLKGVDGKLELSEVGRGDKEDASSLVSAEARTLKVKEGGKIHFGPKSILMKEQPEELRTICPLTYNTSGCLFTLEEKLLNWTSANVFCRSRGTSLASYTDLQRVNAGDKIKAKSAVFWVSEMSAKDLLEEKGKLLEENYKYFGDGTHDVPVSNVKIIDIDSREDNFNHVNILEVDDTVPQMTVDNSSRIIDIPGTDTNSRRTVYTVDTEPLLHDSPPIDKTEDDELESHHQKVRRSAGPLDSLSIPPDAVHLKEFLLLQTTEKETAQKPKLGLVRKPEMPLSDSMSKDLFSLLKPDAEVTSFRRMSLRNKDRDLKKCPVLTCSQGSSKCSVSLRLCSELNSFWCKGKV